MITFLPLECMHHPGILPCWIYAALVGYVFCLFRLFVWINSVVRIQHEHIVISHFRDTMDLLEINEMKPVHRSTLIPPPLLVI